MKGRGTVDLIVRDRETGNALVVASTEASEDQAVLSGKLVLILEGEVTEAPITFAIANDGDITRSTKGRRRSTSRMRTGMLLVLKSRQAQARLRAQ